MTMFLLALQTAADPSTTAGQWYGTQAGIIGATALAVSALKRAIGNVAYLNAIPTWVYAVTVASVLTFLSVHVWGTMPGNLWQLVSQSALSAGASSGFYEWVNRPTASLASSALKADVTVAPANLPTRDDPTQKETP
jgi:hypothetical protein